MNHTHKASRHYGSIAAHRHGPFIEADDFESLFYTLLTLADVSLPWLNLTSHNQILEQKLDFQKVEVKSFRNITTNTNHLHLIRVFNTSYCFSSELNQRSARSRTGGTVLQIL